MRHPVVLGLLGLNMKRQPPRRSLVSGVGVELAALSQCTPTFWVLPVPIHFHHQPHGCAPSAICQHQLLLATIRAPGDAPGPCHALPHPACSSLPSGSQRRGSSGCPSPAPRAPLHPQAGPTAPPGAPHKALGPRDQAGNPSQSAASPPPSAGSPPHPAAALRLFHQAEDCFLNKSKKLRFLLGKFILSHFISFPPIFSPNNVIK